MKLRTLDGLVTEYSARLLVSGRIRERTVDYRKAFDDLVVAWRTKGLDHDSGLQGRFRETIHEIEQTARNHNVGSLHRLLLEIRRAEKDTGLRRQSVYMDRTLRLTNAFMTHVAGSELKEKVKKEMVTAIRSYRRHYAAFADRALAGEPLNGGKGAFRDAAHVLENILIKHFVADFEKDILLLRRWEKDYLLRNEKEYVKRFKRVLTTVRANIAASGIPTSGKTALSALLVRYADDFLALVEQNDDIAVLQVRMESDVEEIESLVENSVRVAITDMARASEETHQYSTQQARFALGIALVALILTVVFAEFIIRRITFPLSTLMALTKIFSNEAVTQEEGDDRNEINSLAWAFGSMSRNISRLIAEMERAEWQLEDVAEELDEVLRRLRDGAEAGRGSKALKQLGVAIEKTRKLGARLHEDVDSLTTKTAAHEEMLNQMISRSR